MRNPFKAKTGEKQSMVRLAVIAGITFFNGTMFCLIVIILTDSEPRHPLAFGYAAVGGFLLLAGGTFTATKQNHPVARDGRVGLINGLVLFSLCSLFFYIYGHMIAKPVIYLYPTQEEEVTVRLEIAGKLTADYPTFDRGLSGWRVTAFPDGHLIDPRDGREYSYLYWEGEGRAEQDWSTGFVVKGSDTRQFLQETLPKLGLTPKEYNEFIVYWYPLMQVNRFNLIHFAGKEYTDTAVLNVTPQPDTVIRVFMVWKPLLVPISVPAQIFPPVNRHGFTVVEWGGSEGR